MNPYLDHITIQNFQEDLISWYHQFKRDLPWRKNLDPYLILVSEIMLQQTQVATVIPYFNRFKELFPTAAALAATDEATLLKAWEGLGYYSRGKNLQESAKMIVNLGYFPQEYTEILKLKGVGPYTAGAVGSIAFSIPVPAVDGNVFRVIGRICAISLDIAKPATRKIFENVVATLISLNNPGDFNQGLMELGATICTPKSPDCLNCPMNAHCKGYHLGVVDQLPVKTKNKRPQKIKYVVGIVENEKGQWFISKRPSTGLLANFYEFVQLACESEAPEKFLTDHLTHLGFHVLNLEFIGSATHVFTHRVWEMQAYKIKVNATQARCGKNEMWVDPNSLDQYALTVAHQRILDIKKDQ